MKVIIAEKPSVARDIARIVGASQRKDGWLEGNGYQVTWAFGHLVTIAEPKVMEARWGGKWAFDQLPMIPEQFKLTPITSGEKQFNTICRLFTACDEIVNATDAGREGELIFRWIYKYSKCEKPFKRLWISDLTDASIKQGLDNLTDGKEFDFLGYSAQCRAFADWMVGLNATRAYSVRHGQLYTVGRVQTPTLALIVERHKLIQGFEKFYYYELHAMASKVPFRWENKDGFKIESKKVAENLHKKCTGHKGVIKKVARRKKKTGTSSLYDLTLLQKECNEKFGYTAQTTLTHAQALYEQHKLITYPRTESRHLSETMRDELPNVLRAAPAHLQPFAQEALARLDGGFKLGKNYINDKKLTDHHAIIPTSKPLKGQLNPDLMNVYELIQKRFIAIFLPDFIEGVTEITLEIQQETFKFKGTQALDVGWRRIYMKDLKQDIPPAAQYPRRAEVDHMLAANFKEGQDVDIDELKVMEKETAPPKPFNDGTLLNAMRFIGRQVDDDSLAAQLKDQGLGTQATRAAVIERLIKSKYIYRKGKSIMPTEKGIKLIDVVVGDLKSPEMTAQWEIKLSDIQEGRIKHTQFMQEIADFTRSFIPVIQNSSMVGGKEDFGTCPKCKKGKIYEGNKNFYCSAYRDGCDFVIWAKMASKRLPYEVIKQLVKDNKTDWVKGFTSKAGKPFDARVELDKEFKTRFSFN